MSPVNPDDEKSYLNFLREWKSHYPDVTTGKGKDKKTVEGLKHPSFAYMRIFFGYATQGHIPGEHIVAILQNDLYATFNTAPTEEVELIPSSVQYVINYLPTESWGNAEKYGKWLNKMKKSKCFIPTEHY